MSVLQGMISCINDSVLDQVCVHCTKLSMENGDSVLYELSIEAKQTHIISSRFRNVPCRARIHLVLVGDIDHSVVRKLF